MADDDGDNIADHQMVGKQGETHILYLGIIQNKINDYRQHNTGNNPGGQGIKTFDLGEVYHS